MTILSLPLSFCPPSRGHIEDVYDLSWSQDSTHLISGSVDNTAIVWNISNGKREGERERESDYHVLSQETRSVF